MFIYVEYFDLKSRVISKEPYKQHNQNQLFILINVLSNTIRSFRYASTDVHPGTNKRYTSFGTLRLKTYTNNQKEID